MLGTAVGDALGLACEGLSAQRQQRWFPSLDGYHLLFGKGLCSDDTEHTCLLAQSLLASGGESAAFERDFAWRLRWWFLGLPAGIGLATLRSIVKLWFFVPDRFRGVYSAGNAPAMRSAMISICFADDEQRMKQLVQTSTRLTHTDPKAECGALAIALAARCSMLGQTFEEYVDDIKRLLGDHGSAGYELAELVTRSYLSVSRGESTESFVKSLGCANGVSGYMYHSVPAVIHAWQSYPLDFERAVTSIIRCGGDTDTTAAMTGAIVGAGVGKNGIPQRWLDDLIEWPRTVSWMEVLARKTADTVGAPNVKRTHPVSATKLLIRNAAFLVVVLLHGLRRLLPPY
jgi:ADP-ribosyl-[dinitrogen reductase] hydrolase